MPSLSVLRDWQHQAEHFFAHWTPEHSGIVVVLVFMLVPAILLDFWAWKRRKQKGA